MIRRLGPWALGQALGPALPCMQAAATDPSPAVQAQGLWALHHVSQGLAPTDENPYPQHHLPHKPSNRQSIWRFCECITLEQLVHPMYSCSDDLAHL